MGTHIEFLSSENSKIKVCVAPNDEELVILQKGKELLQL